MIDFDGDSLTITLPSGQTTISSQEIYSDWKEWVAQSNNAAYLPAFRVIGGDPLGGGLLAGSYFFLQNQHGWRIKPPEEDIVVTITGNLFSEDAGAALFANTAGSFNTSIRLQTSSLTQVAEVNTGSGVSAQDVADIAEAVWSKDLTSYLGSAAGAVLTFVRKLLANRVQISSDDAVTTIYDDDGTTPIHVFDHTDTRNRAPR